jgi:hypothetical protein
MEDEGVSIVEPLPPRASFRHRDAKARSDLIRGRRATELDEQPVRGVAQPDVGVVHGPSMAQWRSSALDGHVSYR